MSLRLCLPLLLALFPVLASAEAGMWPLDRLPKASLEALGLQPDPEQLMQATVRFPEGTGAFVSSRGLVMTNHHVVSGCIAAVSSARAPLLERGFVARTRAQEKRCPGFEVQVLQGIDPLPENLPEEPAARQARLSRWTGAECPHAQRCEVVSLYGGAIVQRYRYRVWDDVRLVFAPEDQAAYFGGDEDNFSYPRFALDLALLRVYDAGRPLRPQRWLKPARQPVREGDALLVSGHPYRTDRLLTVAQLEAQRDVLLPDQMTHTEHALKTLRRYASRGPEATRQAREPIATFENTLKALRGQWQALKEPTLLEAKRAEEARVRQAVPEAEPAWLATAQSARAASALSRAEQAVRWVPGSLLGELVHLLIVRAERRLPEAHRLAEYSGAAAAALESRWAAPTQVLPDLEAAQWLGHLAYAREQLGESHPWVRAWSSTLQAPPGSAAAAEAFTAWLRLSRFAQPAERMALLAQADDGKVDGMAQQDPLLALALQLAPVHREVAGRLAEEVQRPLQGQQARIARARWQVLGNAEAPDANFALRLSFGRAQGVTSSDAQHPWSTQFGGLWERSAARGGQAPFDLPPKLAAARHRIGDHEALNFATTIDVVGGNSGSPVLNAAGEWVGLTFDGNLESLAGQYHFDGRTNRMVAVHQRAIQLALRRIYGAPFLATEMGL